MERIVEDWNSSIVSTIPHTATAVIDSDPKLTAFFASEATITSQRNTKLINELEGLIKNEEDRSLLAKTLDSRKAYQGARDKVFMLMAEGRTAEATKIMEEKYLPLADNYQQMVLAFLDRQRQQLEANTKEAVQQQESAIGKIIAAALVVGGLFSYVMVRALEILRKKAKPAQEMDLACHAASNTEADRRDRLNAFYEILA